MKDKWKSGEECKKSSQAKGFYCSFTYLDLPYNHWSLRGIKDPIPWP